MNAASAAENFRCVAFYVKIRAEETHSYLGNLSTAFETRLLWHNERKEKVNTITTTYHRRQFISTNLCQKNYILVASFYEIVTYDVELM